MDSRLLLHTLLVFLLLLIPAGALYWLERKKLARFCFVFGRMAVQLVVLCLVVWGLFKAGNAWVSNLWLMAVAVGASWLVQKRCGGQGRNLMPVVACGLYVSVFVVGLWLLFVLPVRVFDVRWFVPVMALLMGHSTSMLIRGLSTYLSALKADEQQYEFLRGNGHDHLHALLPFVRRALQAVFAPTVANLTVMGLFTMPLLLCGILLGGVRPINAFVVTLMLTIGCLASSVISLMVTLWLADRLVFDKFGKQKETNE